MALILHQTLYSPYNNLCAVDAYSFGFVWSQYDGANIEQLTIGNENSTEHVILMIKICYQVRVCSFTKDCLKPRYLYSSISQTLASFSGNLSNRWTLFAVG